MEEEKNDKNQRLGLLQQLLKLAEIDNDFQDIEFKFLVILAGQLGISKQELFDMMQDHIAFHPPQKEQDRIIQFQRLCLMMFADGEVKEEELSYVRQMGFRLGLHAYATEEVLRLMLEEKMIPVPPELLLEIFKTFRN
jgi:uncharacterized tellurite resistance protein B-like protein